MTDKLKNLKAEILSDNWGIMQKVTYDYQNQNGKWEKQVREVYDRGDGATALLYNREKKTVILTRQFRIPTYLNGNPDGLLIETCAGKVEKDEGPHECILKEIREETGIEVEKAEKVFEAYMSPGSVTELIHFYIAPYSREMKVDSGGGREDEQENIDVLEIPMTEALDMMRSGQIKDGKTLLLLQYAQLNRIIW